VCCSEHTPLSLLPLLLLLPPLLLLKVEFNRLLLSLLVRLLLSLLFHSQDASGIGRPTW
jgi:hypothetical protein